MEVSSVLPAAQALDGLVASQVRPAIATASGRPAPQGAQEPPAVPSGLDLLMKAREGGYEREFLESAAQQIGKALSEMGSSVSFNVKVEDTGSYYVEVRGRYDGALIKTIPPEYILKLRDSINDAVKGLLMNGRS